MNSNRAALLIQRLWKRYISPRCPRCLYPVSIQYILKKGYCRCPRCPGCLKYSPKGQACSIECNSWFPPMIEYNKTYESDNIANYKDWIKGKPIYTDHLVYYENNNIGTYNECVLA